MTCKITKIWTTKDGKKIRICDMTDRHLLNTIRMLDAHSSIMDLDHFPDFAPDSMAAYYADQSLLELISIWPPELSKLFDALCEERDRRGLDESEFRREDAHRASLRRPGAFRHR